MNLSFDRIRQQDWFEPLLASIFLHIVFIIFSLFIHFQNVSQDKDQGMLSFHLKGGSSNPYVSKKLFAGKEGPNFHPKVGGENYADTVKKLNKSAAPMVFEKPASIQEETTAPPVKKSEEDAVTFMNRNIETELMDTERRAATAETQTKRRSSADFYQEKSMQNAKVGPMTGQGLVKVLSKSLDRIRFYSPSNVSINPEEGMPGFTPSHGEPGGQGPGQGTGQETGQGPWQGPGQGNSNFEFDQGPGESMGDILKYESLDNFLDIAVYTYQNPSDGGKYFMIKIFAKKDQRKFKVMPKEILFTVDASLSITPDRLNEFKRGITYCLTHLNKGDTFNIVAFKDKASFFSPQSVPATPESVKGAERFVSGLASNQRTDVYAAFKKIVELPVRQRPSSVMLLSDGRPTHGVLDSRELINSITRINHKVRPVFAFSGGVRVNRYLLDFIAYQNRGWSEFVRATFDVHQALANFYDKIKDPIFLNLRYRLNGLEEKEVFPKSLPDFYKNAEFTLFGSYKDEDTFSMQLLGDVDGETKELIFTRSLNEAKKGSEDVMKGYAFNKIYYLISQLTTQGHDPNLVKQIETLSRRYGITTPYSPDLRD